jgi:hypothetical protein
VISFINHPFEALYEFIRFRGSTDRKLAFFLGFFVLEERKEERT